MTKWKCPFERIRAYPDCFEDCPDTGECKMGDSWKQIRPLPKLKKERAAMKPTEDLRSRVIDFLQGQYIVKSGDKYRLNRDDLQALNKLFDIGTEPSQDKEALLTDEEIIKAHEGEKCRDCGKSIAREQLAKLERLGYHKDTPLPEPKTWTV